MNGLTAHQSQVGAGSFSGSAAGAAEAAAARGRAKTCKLRSSLGTDSSASALLSVGGGEASPRADGGSRFSRC